MAEIIEIRQNWTPQEQKKLRVCAYARVSSDSDEQQYSYFGQVQHYTQMIQENPDWEYVDIYADSGKTGTKLDKRDDFNRMLKDCRAGKIDKILTKAVSRFARNVRDCVDTVKELKELGVTVYFEEQNLDSGRPQDFTAICIYATIAQEESMSISENLRMGNAARMRRGEYKQGKAPFGYNIQNGKLVINEEQAETVKYIFYSYAEGKGIRKIAEELNRAKKPKKTKAKWDYSAVYYILSNVRYKGDALFQKTYTMGFPYKSRLNRGERPQYYLHHANPGIISAEEYEQVQSIRLEKSKKHYKGMPEKAYSFSKMIFCKECGTLYRSKKINGKLVWICQNRDLGADRCGSAEISDIYIKSAYVLLYNRLTENMELILQPMLAQAELCRISAAEQEAIEKLNMEIAQTTEQVLSINRLRAKGLIAPALYIEETNRLNRQVLDLRKKKKGFIHKNEFDSLLSNTKRLMQEIETTGAIADFDEEQFKRTVEKIYADTNTLTFRLINGLELEIHRDEVK